MEWKRKWLIRKKIQRNRNRRFYLVAQKTATPAMAQFFFELYRYVSGLKKGLLYAGKSLRLRQAVFDYYLDNAGSELLSSISPDNINSDSLHYDIDELAKRIQTNTALITKKFDVAWSKKANDLYNQIVLFSWFVHFDYPVLLAQFSQYGQFNNNDLSANVHFMKARSEAITENLKDFLALTGIFCRDADWNAIFEIVSNMNGISYDIDAWHILEKSVSQVISSEILPLIIQHVDDNTEWENKVLNSKIYYAEDFIEQYIKNAKKTLETIRINNERKKIAIFADEVFNTEIVNAAQYYTDEDLEEFEERGCGGFTKTSAFNYLLSFFNSYLGQIKLLTDVFVIKGFWLDRACPIELSMTLQKLNDTFTKLSDFDKSLADSGDTGAKLKLLLAKSIGKNKKNETLQKRIDSINFEAGDLIKSAADHLSHLNFNLRKLREDGEMDIPNVLHNWDEIADIMHKEDMGLGVCIKKISDMLELIELINATSILATHSILEDEE